MQNRQQPYAASESGSPAACNIINPADIPCREICDTDRLAKSPVVSVAMITYNHEPFIANAIEGVINQETEYPFELIIGEDCSTDSTREIVLQYQQRYPQVIRVLVSDNNVSSRMNGLRTRLRARGKYLAFCEGDDHWHAPDKLQIQVDYMETHPAVGLVHSDVHTATENGKTVIYNTLKTKKISNQTKSDIFLDIVFRDYRIFKCTVLMRRQLERQIVANFPEVHCTLRFQMNDTPLWLDACKLSSLHYIDRTLATYNVHGASLSNNTDINKDIDFRNSGSAMLAYYLKKYGYPQHYMDAVNTKAARQLLQKNLILRKPRYTQYATDCLRRANGRLSFYEKLLAVASKHSVLSTLVHFSIKLKRKASLALCGRRFPTAGTRT